MRSSFERLKGKVLVASSSVVMFALFQNFTQLDVPKSPIRSAPKSLRATSLNSAAEELLRDYYAPGLVEAETKLKRRLHINFDEKSGGGQVEVSLLDQEQVDALGKFEMGLVNDRFLVQNKSIDLRAEYSLRSKNFELLKTISKSQSLSLEVDSNQGLGRVNWRKSW